MNTKKNELKIANTAGRQYLDILPAVDVLLRTVDHADVSAAQWQRLVGQDLPGVRALVHQVQLGDHADGADAVGVGILVGSIQTSYSPQNTGLYYK